MHICTTHRLFQSLWPRVVACVVLTALKSNAPCQNLVPNPGFEETDTCWNGLGTFALEGPTGWFSANGTPDHLQGCLPYGSVVGLPMNMFTFQEPFAGSYCAGFFTYHQNGADEQREWIMAPLLDPMVPGQTYYCSFRANAAFGGNAQYPQVWLANDKVGMLFTTDELRWEWGDPFPAKPNYAHVLYPEILADSVGWTLVSGSFVADSAYQYVMIGQFFTNALTDTLHFADPNSVFPWYPRAYTLVDAVCVSANPMGCDLGQVLVEGSSRDVLLFPNPAKDDLLIRGASWSNASILDALGRVVRQDRITADAWSMGVGDWQRGMYVLWLGDGEKTSVFKFVLTDE